MFILFLSIYLALYAFLNLYAYRWFRPAFGWKRRATLFFALFAVLMMVLPIAVRVCEAHGLLRAAAAGAWIGHAWMLAVFWIFVFGLAVDSCIVLNRFLALFMPAKRGLRPEPRPVVIGLAAISAALLVWGVFEARSPALTTVRIVTPRWSPEAESVRVLQISDLHVGLMHGRGHLLRIARLVSGAEADLIVCTGDALDSAAGAREDFSRVLSALDAPLGKFAVLGNHEFYAGAERSLAFLKDAGFIVLREKARLIRKGGAVLAVAGVDSRAGRVMGTECGTDPDRALPRREDGVFTLLLRHEPEVEAGCLDRFDLQVSGHTHGGQVFPFQFLVPLAYPKFRGLYELNGGTWLYVSRGLGTWGLPVRVLARPEMTLFIIQGCGAKLPAYASVVR